LFEELAKKRSTRPNDPINGALNELPKKAIRSLITPIILQKDKQAC